VVLGVTLIRALHQLRVVAAGLWSSLPRLAWYLLPHKLQLIAPPVGATYAGFTVVEWLSTRGYTPKDDGKLGCLQTPACGGPLYAGVHGVVLWVPRLTLRWSASAGFGTRSYITFSYGLSCLFFGSPIQTTVYSNTKPYTTSQRSWGGLLSVLVCVRCFGCGVHLRRGPR
jgi:hypothetical protein